MFIACSVLYRTRFGGIFDLVIIEAKEYNDIGVLLGERAYKDGLYDRLSASQLIFMLLYRL